MHGIDFCMIKTAFVLFFCLTFSIFSYAQTNQAKAEKLVNDYLNNMPKLMVTSNLKFSTVHALKNSYSDTKTYKNFQRKIDSLKLEGRKIDARIPKMKTDAEINQSKKDSKQLSNHLVATSDQMIDFMTQYKTTPIGWTIKAFNQNGSKSKKTFFLNKELTKVIQVK